MSTITILRWYEMLSVKSIFLSPIWCFRLRVWNSYAHESLELELWTEQTDKTKTGEQKKNCDEWSWRGEEVPILETWLGAALGLGCRCCASQTIFSMFPELVGVTKGFLLNHSFPMEVQLLPLDGIPLSWLLGFFETSWSDVNVFNVHCILPLVA